MAPGPDTGARDPDGPDAGPDIAGVARLLGEPARAAMLVALLDGRALTATELADAAAVARPTASAHLSRLVDAGLLVVHRQGRHRYHGLAGSDVAELLERLSGVAARTERRAPVTGPPDPALRRARVCYDHLAGALAVAFFEAARGRGWIETRPGEGERTAAALTAGGAEALGARGIDVERVLGGRRPPCLACMDWSERRPHAAGALGSAVLALCLSRRWARRTLGSRAVRFGAAGERAFVATLCR